MKSLIGRAKRAIITVETVVLLGISLGNAEAIMLTGEFLGIAEGELLVKEIPATTSAFFKQECMNVRGDQGDCVAPVIIKFTNAPRPGTFGVLTVVAAGDIGHPQVERNQIGFEATDFVFLYGVLGAGQDPQRLQSPLPRLFEQTVGTCPRLPDDPNQTHRGINDDTGQVCGPNAHSVNDPQKRLDITFGVREDGLPQANGTDFFTDMLEPANRGDFTVIEKNELTQLLTDGMISIILWPNPGTGTAVADIKYKSAILVYDAVVPEPSSFLLFGLGLVGLSAVAWRRKGRK